MCPRFQQRSAASLASDEASQILDTCSASMEVADSLVESLLFDKPCEMRSSTDPLLVVSFKVRDLAVELSLSI